MLPTKIFFCHFLFIYFEEFCRKILQNLRHDFESFRKFDQNLIKFIKQPNTPLNYVKILTYSIVKVKANLVKVLIYQFFKVS